MSKWQVLAAEEYCLKVADGTHDTPKPLDIGEYLITSKHITGGKLNLTNAYRISKEDFAKINQRSKVDRWDVLLTMIGTVGEVVLVDHDPNYAIKNIGLFKCGDEIKARWLKYYLQSSDGKAEIQSRIGGTTQEYIALGELRKLPVPCPSLPEQKAIASVLSSLDDKIDLLHRQNKTLEAMAETLFRQWFVEEAQEDLEEKPLSEVTKIGIGRTPPRKEFHWFSRNVSDVKWVSIKDLGEVGLFVFDTSEYLTRDAVETFKIPIIPEGTVLLSFKMTVGRVGITTEPMLSNEAIAHFKFDENTPFSKEYLYVFLKTFKYASLGSTSSIVTAINSSMIKEIRIVIPDEKAMNNFRAKTKPLFNKIRQNQTQIRTLEKLRDTLLPKLMSGEVHVEYDAN